MASKLICLGVILAVLQTATALTCYSCDSSKGENCKYGWLALTYGTVDCSQVSTGSGFLDVIGSVIPTNCAKLIGKDKQGNEYVYRGCFPSTGPVKGCAAIAKFAQFAAESELDSLDCVTCDTDKCNSATKMGAVSAVGLLVACIAYLF